MGDEFKLLADKVAPIPELLPGHAQDFGVTDGAAVNLNQRFTQVSGDLKSKSQVIAYCAGWNANFGFNPT